MATKIYQITPSGFNFLDFLNSRKKTKTNAQFPGFENKTVGYNFYRMWFSQAVCIAFFNIENKNRFLFVPVRANLPRPGTKVDFDINESLIKKNDMAF